MQILYSIAVRLIRCILYIVPISGKTKQFIDGRKRIWDDIKTIPNDREIIWMHCASLGEYEQGLPILNTLKAKTPQAFFLVSFFSPSGYLVKKTHQVADLTTYLPWDNRRDIRRFVKKVQPAKVLFVKYEFWPNLLIELQKQKIPTYLIAGLFQPHQLFFKPWGGWFRKILNGFSHIFVQNKESHELLKCIGIKQVSLSGDTRYDRVHQEKDEMPFMNAFINDRKCIVAGSTWPQDIAVLKDIIIQSSKDWCWLIAPHEINAQAIETLMGELPLNSQRFTKCDSKYLPKTPVLVLDNVGLLSDCYAYAQIAYIGGGMGTKGLHNILEPAAAGIPIVIGKNYNRYPEAVELIQQGGIISISSKDEATKKLLLLMQDKVIRKEKGDINKHFVNKNIGATNKILDKIG